MAELNKNAEKIFKMKYSQNGESWNDACLRVASHVANAEKNFGKTEEEISKVAAEYFSMISELMFLPGGRILSNAGTGIKSLLNCFRLGLGDSRNSIYGALKNSAEIFANGGGVGFDLSTIREEGAHIKSTGGTACLTGDTIVYRDDSKDGKEKTQIKISRLYELFLRNNRPLAHTKLRCMDEKSHVIFRNKLVGVVYNGVQDVYSIATKLGYNIKCTSNHRFMDENFLYKEIKFFSVGDNIVVNGTKFCEDCGKPCCGKHLCIGCHNKRQIKEDALPTTARQRKSCRNAVKEHCELCNNKNVKFEVHHKDKNPYNNNEDNLINLCIKCHSAIHYAEHSFGDPYKQRYVTTDEIISIEYYGKEDVYDIQMESPNHNFIANGFVSHNSGPLSFATLFNQTGEVIQQASRRAAMLMAMRVDHPDIEKFIDYKATPDRENIRLLDEYHNNLSKRGERLKNTKYFDVLKKTLLDNQLSHVNVSVSVTDAFMQKVKENGDWDLVGVVDKKVKKTVKAKELLMKIAQKAWESGDPGLLFLDTIEKDNMCPDLFNISTPNPCLSGDAKVLTVEDGPVAFKDLAESGKDVLVYSWNPENKHPVIRMMRNPRKTGENKHIIKITFDSGLELKCTDNHKLISFRGNKVEAKDLVVGQSIRSYTVDKHKDGQLRVLFVNNLDATEHKWVHRMLWEGAYGSIPDGKIVHHIDKNPLNNKVENLELLSPVEHNSRHYQDRLENGFYHGSKPNYSNHKVVSIEDAGYEDVYNGTVDDTHTYVIADEAPIHGVYTGIVSANCGEINLEENGACCLGSINVNYFLTDRGYDWEHLETVVRNSVRFLDDVIEITELPIKEINEQVKATRRIGLGMFGLADLLAQLGIPYGSEESKNFSSYLSWFISFFAWSESMVLASERGTFPMYNPRTANLRCVEKVVKNEYNPLSSDSLFDMEDIRKNGVRNIGVTTVPPTGSISILAGVNSGIEPFFALAYRRNITEGVGNTAKSFVIEVNPYLMSEIEKLNFPQEDLERIKKEILKTGSVQSILELPDRIRFAFRTANEISYKDHIEIQAKIQASVSGALSKTVNLPENCTVEDIYNAYLLAWELGCKGITVFRNNCKEFQILNSGT